MDKKSILLHRRAETVADSGPDVESGAALQRTLAGARCIFIGLQQGLTDLHTARPGVTKRTGRFVAGVWQK